VGLPHLS